MGMRTQRGAAAAGLGAHTLPTPQLLVAPADSLMAGQKFWVVAHGIAGIASGVAAEPALALQVGVPTIEEMPLMLYGTLAGKLEHICVAAVVFDAKVTVAVAVAEAAAQGAPFVVSK